MDATCYDDAMSIDGAKDEEHDPLDLLPEEVWELVFEFFENSSIHLNKCCLASTTWNKMLHGRKPAWMFQEVFSHLYPYMTNRDILKCRVTCRDWKAAVDKSIENHPCHNPSAPYGSDGDLSRESVYYPLIAKKLYQVRFNWIEELRKFCTDIEPYKNSHKSPIIGRSVCLYARLDPEWMTNALIFLSIFGKHIWYFTFQGPHPPQLFMQYLTSCLDYLPNLRKLGIFASYDPPLNNEPEEVLQEDYMLTANEFHSLETLEINSRVSWIQNRMMKRFSSQLKRLELHAWDTAYSKEDHSPLGNLRELTLMVDSNSHLQNLTRLNCPLLRKLTLNFRYDSVNVFVVTQVLNNFSKSLRTLKLFLSTTATLGRHHGYELADICLPKLHVLVLVNTPDLHLNLLEHMPSIEHFYFETWLHSQPDPYHINDLFFCDCSNKCKPDPAIWRYLPLLKKLTHVHLNPNSMRHVYSRIRDSHELNRRCL